MGELQGQPHTERPVVRSGTATGTGVPQGAIEQLSGRFGLHRGQEAAIAALVGALCRDPLAPTAVREPRSVLDDHIADSLVGLELPQLHAARRIVDLGAGAGLPGLPLAIALPGATVTLLESSARKCAFLVRTAEACGLANAIVANARAESWSRGFGAFDVVTARAVAPLDVVAEYAAPLLAIGGSLVVWRGRRSADAEGAARRAAAVLGLEVAEPIHVVPYGGAQQRHLHVFTKVRTTPAGFPRRPGMAAKRPLGGRG